MMAGGAVTGRACLRVAQAANLRDFRVLPDDLSFEPFAVMLPRGDWAFRLAVNTDLARVFRSGDVVELYSKYFSRIAPSPPVWLGAVLTFGGLPNRPAATRVDGRFDRLSAPPVGCGKATHKFFSNRVRTHEPKLRWHD